MAAPSLTVSRAKALRSRMSLPEVLLWRALRRNQLEGYRFRRQHPIGPFILDFYCEDVRLAVEIDGASHEGRGELDRRRDAWLEEQGVQTLRIDARYVLASIGATVDVIRSALHARPSRLRRSSRCA